MKLVKSLLLGSVAGFAAVAGASAADLPSKKAAPASYVKICDAYGAGFFYIPGTDTCLRVGGYVRAEYQYTPAKRIVTLQAAGFTNPAQVSGSMDTSGMEMRGRVELDARTQTAWGTARTFIRLRMTNNSGIRSFSETNNATIANAGSAQSTTLEAASIQWAGFTFGLAPSNYGFMPGIMYSSTPWTGFPNGQKQIAYTATFGGGLSATVAIEDKGEWNTPSAKTYNNTPANGYQFTANIRYDQPWGWAIVHGTIGNNSYNNSYTTTGAAPGPLAGIGATGFGALNGSSTKSEYAIGATAMFNLPMLAPGDKLYLTANYASGWLGGLMSSGGLNNLSNASGGRILAGIGRVDSAITVTGGLGTLASPFTIGNTTGWNVGGLLIHNWSGNWRSQATAGYIEINPSTTTLANQWGKGRMFEVSHALIFSPVKDFDIGLELQYINLKSNIQNANAAFVAAGSPGASESGWTSKLRIERNF